MPPRLVADRPPSTQAQSLSVPLLDRVLMILWPAFVMAGVLEMLAFAVIDPSDLRWFGGDHIEWSRTAVYSVTFLIFWAGTSTSGAITSLLESLKPERE